MGGPRERQPWWNCDPAPQTERARTVTLHLPGWRARALSQPRGNGEDPIDRTYGVWRHSSTLPPVHAYASIDRAHYRAWEFHLAVPLRCFPCKMRQAVGVLIRQSSVASQSLEAPPPADVETESCCARSSNCRPAKGRQERIRATTSEVNS